MYAPSASPSPRTAATNGETTSLVCHSISGGNRGRPIEMVGTRYARLYQKISWISSGVPRKNQTYAEAAQRDGRWSLSKSSAHTVPITAPTAIPISASAIVVASPFSTFGTNRYLPTTGHSNRGFVSRNSAN